MQVPLPPPRQKTFLENLQALGEPMKLRVLVASSAVVMVVVVYVWIGYFNSIVMGNPAAQQLADQSAVAQQSAGATGGQPIAVQPGTAGAATGQEPSAPGFWAELGSGFASLYYGVINGFRGAGTALQSPAQYDVKPASP